MSYDYGAGGRLSLPAIELFFELFSSIHGQSKTTWRDTFRPRSPAVLSPH